MNKKTFITMMLALITMAGQAQTIPTDWFKTDTITIRGRIEGYDAERNGLVSQRCSATMKMSSKRTKQHRYSILLLTGRSRKVLWQVTRQ